MATNSTARSYRTFVEDVFEEEPFEIQPTSRQPGINSKGFTFLPTQPTAQNGQARQFENLPSNWQTSLPRIKPALPSGIPGFSPPAQPFPQRTSGKRGINFQKTLSTGLLIGNIGLKIGLFFAGAIIALVLAYLLVSGVTKWWQTWQDDLTFGRPRTVQLDQFVGHNEQDGAPSHFIVQNNNRQITVVEYPGGDASKTRVLTGPRLFGKDSELAPIKVLFQDLNGDGHVDMVLSVENQEVIYINENSSFRAIKNDERARLARQGGGK